MTVLLVGTFVVAGSHTLLWMPRSFQAMRQNRKLRKQYHGQLEYQRFKPLHRRLHIMVIISFLGLATTGMTLKFSYLGWAQAISELLADRKAPVSFIESAPSLRLPTSHPRRRSHPLQGQEARNLAPVPVRTELDAAESH